MKGYPKKCAEIFEQSNPDYEEALANVATKQNCNTYNRICSKITSEEEHGKLFGSTDRSI